MSAICEGVLRNGFKIRTKDHYEVKGAHILEWIPLINRSDGTGVVRVKVKFVNGALLLTT